MFFVYGLYKPSLAVELGINKLKETGFKGCRIVVVTLDPCVPGKQKILDSMYRADGMSLVDGIAMAASIGMLFGVIYGSVVPIGPVALGLVGMFAGGGAGYLVDMLLQKKGGDRGDSPSGEIIVAVECHSEEEAAEAEKIMKEQRVTALGRGNGFGRELTQH